MNELEIDKINDIFSSHPEIKLVYLFGSVASGKTGPLSDYDFAIYFDGIDKKNMFELKIKLMNGIGNVLKTNKVDVVILNDLDSPELAYNIIKNGKLIYEQEPFKVLIEPKILNKYFDFHYLLLANNLTKT